MIKKNYKDGTVFEERNLFLTLICVLKITAD